jgi:hypothetical protein
MTCSTVAQHSVAGPSGRQLPMLGRRLWRVENLLVARPTLCRSSVEGAAALALAEKPGTGPNRTCTVHFKAENVTVPAEASEELMQVSRVCLDTHADEAMLIISSLQLAIPSHP